MSLTTILVTGGAGYIGSHTCVELLNMGYRVVVLDNFTNSRLEALRRVERISGRPLTVVNGDIRDRALLESTLKQHECEAVIHFAGLKAVGESVQLPLHYYDNNVVGTLRLLEAMQSSGVTTLVFSSSATVYGDPVKLPYTVDHPLAPTNPYGRSKRIIEDMLRDWHQAWPASRIAILRYFNPVGAHASGLIGEDPQGVPNNLMPFIAQVAVGRRSRLSIWGNDYPTPDGTGVRDYIHVVDLALGHLRALEALPRHPLLTLNLGTGQGYSVLQMVQAFEQACGHKIPCEISPRRPGDIAAYYADVSKTHELLSWSAQRGIAEMCADTWRWQQANPNGYTSNGSIGIF